MNGKQPFLVLIGILLTLFSAAQKPQKEVVDTSFLDEDYDLLFNELDALLDSITAPRSFTVFSVGAGNSFLNTQSKIAFELQTDRRVTYSPSIAHFARQGWGLGATAMIVNDGENINPYQLSLTGSYDYLRNRKFITGIALTHFFTRDSTPFYTSPLKNEAYLYFTYKGFWLKPTVAASYGWGSRSDYREEQEEIRLNLLLAGRGFTRINTTEKVNDFNLITSIRHDFYWMEVLGKKDYVRFTPQLVFTSGTQKFGFNQSSSSYATLPRNGANVLYSSDQVQLDDQLYFQPLSLSSYVKAEYSKGKFFVQPQLIFDYYFPAADKKFITAFVMNAGLIF